VAGATEQAPRTDEAGEDGTLARAKAALAKCSVADRTSRSNGRTDASAALTLVWSGAPAFTAPAFCPHRLSASESLFAVAELPEMAIGGLSIPREEHKVTGRPHKAPRRR
jgi:hypothetical protein